MAFAGVISVAFLMVICMLQHQLSFALMIAGAPVHPVQLRSSDPLSPWCYAATFEPGSTINSDNLLATQVWPSARSASTALESYINKEWAVCEFGCGPGLPSLTAAKLGAKSVVATDFDDFALELVRKAANDQGLSNLSTQIFDLTDFSDVPAADLYVMSDVFEQSRVARGAAATTVAALQAGASVWVFAQYDRVQRELYLAELEKLLPNLKNELKWSSTFPGAALNQLWLCDVDENYVSY